jgi:hypothetical protein
LVCTRKFIGQTSEKKKGVVAEKAVNLRQIQI